MKRILLVVLAVFAILVAFLLVGTAEACPPKPCPDAVLVPSTSHMEHRHGGWHWSRNEGTHWDWGNWKNGTCDWWEYDCEQKSVSDNNEYWDTTACHSDTICHVAGRGNNPANYVTLTLPWQAIYGGQGQAGHFNENGTPQAGHEDDYLGACNVPARCTDTVLGTPQETAYGTWSAWTYNPSTGLEERTRSKTTYSAPLLDAYDGLVCTPGTPTTTTETETRDYAACQGTAVPTYGEWSEWAWKDGVLTRERTVTYNDATSGAFCGSDIEYEYDEVGFCQYNKQLAPDDPLCVPPPPPPPPPYCRPYNVGTWYECNTGNSTWSAPSASKCWCQGLTGRVHYHTTYDCGKSYVTEGNWDDAPDWLGHYPGEACPIGGC